MHVDQGKRACGNTPPQFGFGARPTGGNKVTTTPVFSQEEKKTAEEAIGEVGHQSVQGSVLYKEKGL